MDILGDAFVAGGTTSANFPTTVGAFQSANGGYEDAFAVKVAPGGTTLAYATYAGGGNNDQAQGIAVDPQGEAVVAGWTASANFPTLNAQQPTLDGTGTDDAFVLKLLPRPTPPAITAIRPDTGISSTDALTKATTLSVLGTGLPGATVEVYRGGVGYIGDTTVGSGSTWSFGRKRGRI